MTRKRLTAAAFMLLCFTGLPTAGMAQGCMSRQDGRVLLEQGRVAPLPVALQRAGVSRDQVVEVQLCQSGAGFVYRVRVLQPGGRVRSINVPAG